MLLLLIKFFLGLAFLFLFGYGIGLGIDKLSHISKVKSSKNKVKTAVYLRRKVRITNSASMNDIRLFQRKG